MQTITTFEHAMLTQADFDNPSDFNWLIEQNFEGLTLGRKHQQWQLKVGHDIGVIGLPSGTQLEILPKISQQAAIVPTRQWLSNLLQMLWQATPSKALPNIAEQSAVNFRIQSLPQWLGQYFWQHFCQYQPNQIYQALAQNQAYLQGKLLLKEQLTQNAHQPHKFYSQSEHFAPNTATNQLIKATFQRLSQLGLLPSRRLLPLWQTVSDPAPNTYDNLFAQSQLEVQRLTSLARQQTQCLLNVCHSVLGAQASLATVGQSASAALLFNMHSLFEKWVTAWVSNAAPAFSEVKAQSTQALVTHGTATLLSIKPDLVFSYNAQTVVADIKWKTLSALSDISLADLYQLLTYADETRAQQGWLIYPTLEVGAQPQAITLAQPRACAFWWVPFCMTTGRLALGI